MVKHFNCYYYSSSTFFAVTADALLASMKILEKQKANKIKTRTVETITYRY